MAINPYAVTDTFQLLQAIQQVKPPANYLTGLFFPNRMPTVTTEFVGIEFRKLGRMLAPFIVEGSRGVNVRREQSEARYYKPPTMAVRRTIGMQDVQQRIFGETPIFSPLTAEQRAAQMQADDLVMLMNMIENRLNAMSAELLTTGKITVKGYADDGAEPRVDVIDFGDDNIIHSDWTDVDATIYEDLYTVSNRIQESSGIIPTVAVCGANVEKYLLNNKEIRQWLMIPNRENLAMAGFAPSFTAPQARFIGQITSLNLTLISYLETYTGDDGAVRKFIPDDTVIIGVPGKGRIISSAITLFNRESGWQTYASPIVPQYSANEDAQAVSLTLYSKQLPVPEEITDWISLKVK